MKYMGSKRRMLQNGLGELLHTVAPTRNRFFDLFCGTGVVSGFVASRFPVPVVASDLQQYAVILASSQIEIVKKFNPDKSYDAWIASARKWLIDRDYLVASAIKIRPQNSSYQSWRDAVLACRYECSQLPPEFSLSAAYGGYYFSPSQAVWFDALRSTLPIANQKIALAALIQAASSCAASPGHTAQPLGLRDEALPHIAAAWSRDPGTLVHKSLKTSALHSVLVNGKALRSDAVNVAAQISETDIAFIDPPYSAVQYSRFYHVLEAIAIGKTGQIEGNGRYPPRSERPQSRFCKLTESSLALHELLQTIAATGAQAIITFPAGEASNGLSGAQVEAIAHQFFRIRTKKISSIFSTMGGNDKNRKPRHQTSELVLHLTSR